ncbi:MAG: pyridoxine 5'-phosphate synthase [Elusimicrobia bacterium RIFCSPLOWO2_12_FULL_59_9]|nr:MAG: pyridoxine 5'-phosphate synthase [Elusimicrobia bacterium RIFCSPLOWO2_12_FULL_59_9]
MSVSLGVNIDHVATLRQARRGGDPDPVSAARICKSAGANSIVVHLRQDRRHIQEEDLLRLRKEAKLPLHVEMCSAAEMAKIALKVRPDSVCLVPERAGELTTEGGLNLGKNQKAIASFTKRLKRAGIMVSYFVDPNAASVRAAQQLGADAVELCTSKYALARNKAEQAEELERLELAGYLACELGLELHAGHALDYDNVAPVARIKGLRYLNIGFSIIARSVFSGLKEAVVEMRRLID